MANTSHACGWSHGAAAARATPPWTSRAPKHCGVVAQRSVGDAAPSAQPVPAAVPDDAGLGSADTPGAGRWACGARWPAIAQPTVPTVTTRARQGAMIPHHSPRRAPMAVDRPDPGTPPGRNSAGRPFGGTAGRAFVAGTGVDGVIS